MQNSNLRWQVCVHSSAPSEASPRASAWAGEWPLCRGHWRRAARPEGSREGGSGVPGTGAVRKHRVPGHRCAVPSDPRPENAALGRVDCETEEGGRRGTPGDRLRWGGGGGAPNSPLNPQAWRSVASDWRHGLPGPPRGETGQGHWGLGLGVSNKDFSLGLSTQPQQERPGQPGANHGLRTSQGLTTRPDLTPDFASGPCL